MKTTSILLHTFVAVALVLGAACRSSSNTTVTPGSASVGQQLIDLKRALDTGAISQKEYESMRKALVKQND